MSELYKVAGRNLVIIVIAAAAIIFLIGTTKVFGTQPVDLPDNKKFFVCKYVGKPDVDEVLQTGNNPISVSENALTPPIVVGGYFNDAQGRSYVVAEDTGQDEPECPVPENPEEPEEPEKPEEPETPDEPETPAVPSGGK